jgi:hypothetical protein
MNSSPNQKVAEDVSARSSKMPRNSALLYRNKAPKDATSAHYRGLLKLENGDAYWVGLWVRRIDQERVLEIKVSRKIS